MRTLAMDYLASTDVEVHTQMSHVLQTIMAAELCAMDLLVCSLYKVPGKKSLSVIFVYFVQRTGTLSHIQVIFCSFVLGASSELQTLDLSEVYPGDRGVREFGQGCKRNSPQRGGVKVRVRLKNFRQQVLKKN